MPEYGDRGSALPRSAGRAAERAFEYSAAVGRPTGAAQILAALERAIEAPVWLKAPAAIAAATRVSEPSAAAARAAARLVAGGGGGGSHGVGGGSVHGGGGHGTDGGDVSGGGGAGAPAPDEPPLTLVALAGAGPGAPPAHLVCECDLSELGDEERALLEEAAVFLERHRALVAQLRVSRRAAGREFIDRTSSGDVSPTEIEAWARALGLTVTGHVVAVVAQVAGAQPADLEEIASGLEDLADADGLTQLVVIRDGEFCGLLLAGGGGRDLAPFAVPGEHQTTPVRSPSPAADPQATLERFEALAGPRLERLGGALGTSSVIATDVSDAVRVLHDARRVSQLNHLTSPTTTQPAQPVAEQPLVMRLLGEHRSEMETLRSVMLDPLEAYDRRHGSELVRTLDVFLSTGGQWAVSATMLGIHVNTLRYRLSRVEKCTGRDPASMAARVDFYLALRAREEEHAAAPHGQAVPAAPALEPGPSRFLSSVDAQRGRA